MGGGTGLGSPLEHLRSISTSLTIYGRTYPDLKLELVVVLIEPPVELLEFLHLIARIKLAPAV